MSDKVIVGDLLRSPLLLLLGSPNIFATALIQVSVSTVKSPLACARH